MISENAFVTGNIRYTATTEVTPLLKLLRERIDARTRANSNSNSSLAAKQDPNRTAAATTDTHTLKHEQEREHPTNCSVTTSAATRPTTQNIYGLGWGQRAGVVDTPLGLNPCRPPCRSLEDPGDWAYSVYDPDFGARARRRYRYIADRDEFDYGHRVHKYGKDIAEEYYRVGLTPHEARDEYRRKKERLNREFKEEMAARRAAYMANLQKSAATAVSEHAVVAAASPRHDTTMPRPASAEDTSVPLESSDNVDSN